MVKYVGHKYDIFFNTGRVNYCLILLVFLKQYMQLYVQFFPLSSANNIAI